MSIELLKEKADWVRRETLRIHGRAPETRIASSLSCVEILTVLYYGKILNFNPRDPKWEGRDRVVISKAHGAISFYPILADLGFIAKEELDRVCREAALLGGIPDMLVPGFETINGSLGHGLGVACGMALALKRKGREEKVFVLLGDGELYEGSVWEAVMFAAEHKLDNLMAIVDNNQVCMLDFCKNVIDLNPLEEKFRVFGWQTCTIDGHAVSELYRTFKELKADENDLPKMVIADTKKGKGVKHLESDPLSHIRVLKAEEIKVILEGLK